MNTFNEQEFLNICSKFNTQPHAEDITLEYESDSYFSKVKHSVLTDRRGEVVFCVIRPDGKIITITCEEYPEGVFRIPTGGIGHSEDIIDAVYRETKEELGVKTDIISFAGALKIKFKHKNDFVMFYSYIFILKELGGNLLVDASDDEISEVMEANLDELAGVVENLGNIKGKWHDWGRFRYETSNAVLKYLKAHQDEIFGAGSEG
ncbi:MAG: NUDIX hydrolase [Bacillota bacterium]|nr:NUDIX hydrolase [Bacillota bacterium]